MENITFLAQEETVRCEMNLPKNWELAYFYLFISTQICMSKAQ